MLKCKKCGGQGYIEDWYHYGDRARPILRQCCDVSAYSRRVQEMNGAVLPEIRETPLREEEIPCQVIPFRPRSIRLS